MEPRTTAVESDGRNGIGAIISAGHPNATTAVVGGGSSSPGPTPDRDMTPSGAGPEDLGNGSKKRKSGPGSRSVAHLTPEQLAKKRANDREAQRAIRERQKLRNEQYEREIQELKSQRPYQELQAAQQQLAAVQAELDSAKRILASVVAMVEPVLGRSPAAPGYYPGPSPGPGAPAPMNIASPTLAPSPGAASVATHHTHGTQSTSSTHTRYHADPSPQTSDPFQLSAFTQQQHDLVHGLELGPERLGLDFVLDPTQKIAKIHASFHGAQDTPSDHHLPMKHDWTVAALTAPPSTLSLPSPIPPSSPFIPHPLPSPSTASLPFRNCPPTCPLDSLLLDFLSERRQRVTEGLSPSEILGPRYPSVSSLLNPSHTRHSHPLSKVFTDILARFPDIATLPERVAVLYIMFLIMRWQVSPTPENYARLPVWCRAMPAQLSTPHPAWIDHLPFPAMREYLITHYTPAQFPFENFFIPFTMTLSLNWPYEDVDALLMNPAGEELMINPVFERHLRRLENWTLGDEFEDAFPRLRGTYNLKSERRGGRRVEWGEDGGR